MTDEKRKEYVKKFVNCSSPYGTCVGCKYKNNNQNYLNCINSRFNDLIKEIEAEAIKEFMKKVAPNFVYSDTDCIIFSNNFFKKLIEEGETE